MICLGCGSGADSSDTVCPVCFEKLKATLAKGHWPLETSLSLRALELVETGCRALLERPWEGVTLEEGRARDELQNLVNIIRAHLQHVECDEHVARKLKKDPLLL
jgi:hypothetical protein